MHKSFLPLRDARGILAMALLGLAIPLVLLASYLIAALMMAYIMDGELRGAAALMRALWLSWVR